MRKALFILGQLSDEDVDWLIQNGVKKEFPQDHILINKGTVSEHLYIVLSGSFSISSQKEGGKEIAKISSGEILGEMSFIDAAPPQVWVRSKENSTVLAVPLEIIRREFVTNTGFAARFYLAIAVFLSDRLRNTVSNLGYGEAVETDLEEDELDMNVMGSVHMAGQRFERIMKKLAR